MAVFVCPEKRESEKRVKVLCKLQQLLKEVENKAKIPIQEYVPVCIPCCPETSPPPKEELKKNCDIPLCNPCCINSPPAKEETKCPCCGPCQPEAFPAAKEEIKQQCFMPICMPCCPELVPPPKEEPKNQFPDIMVCYKERCKNNKNNGKTNPPHPQETYVRLKHSKSRELRCGNLYTGCSCEKRDGLQDDCPRTGCHGSPECLTKPDPICGPSEFANAKHLTKKTDAYLARISGQQPNQQTNGSGSEENVKYKCFSASVNPPINPVCFTTCVYEQQQ